MSHMTLESAESALSAAEERVAAAENAMREAMKLVTDDEKEGSSQSERFAAMVDHAAVRLDGAMQIWTAWKDIVLALLEKIKESIESGENKEEEHQEEEEHKEEEEHQEEEKNE
eukprot:TRINITY_DN2311_c0_g1_i2.p1 TRINITY_DN2311_c0_g1~~TRINITY_DN2311_c0_g1_i2.p1  ORF type:complete len:124 (+),score=42.40 TRINITY_DN2311_c0_g1_i2:31-372(+)